MRERQILTEPPKVLVREGLSILGDEALLRTDGMAYGVLLGNGAGSGVAIGFTKEVLTHEALYVASVAWNLLVSYHVVWTTDPVFRKSAPVAENLAIFVKEGHKFV